MERLLVDGEDHHLRRAEDTGIVERPDLDERRSRQRLRPGRQVRAALAAEFTSHRVRDVAAAELLGRSLDPREARVGHSHDDVGMAAGDVLTFPTVTLALEERVASGLVADRPAVASTFHFHDVLRFWHALTRRTRSPSIPRRGTLAPPRSPRIPTGRHVARRGATPGLAGVSRRRRRGGSDGDTPRAEAVRTDRSHCATWSRSTSSVDLATRT